MAGVPGGIRTHGPRIRNSVLYPAELRGRTFRPRAYSMFFTLFNRGEHVFL